LELRGVSAEHSMQFVTIGRNSGADQVVDFDGLLVANQRNYADAQRLARIVLAIFRLLYRGRNERSDESALPGG